MLALAGRKLIVWDEDKNKLVFSVSIKCKGTADEAQGRRSINDNSNVQSHII